MRIMAVNGYGALPGDMQSELQRALKWFENTFLVNPNKKPTNFEDVISRIPEYRRFSTVFVQTPEKRANFHVQSKNFEKLLGFSDFSIFIISHPIEKCKNDLTLLAEALPISLFPDTRPPLAVMSICPRSHQSIPFFDLFRHEILHGMGYGLIIDKSNSTYRPSQKYTWKTPKGAQITNRHFLDFDNFALKFAKLHFGCPKMEGIEADGERKNHLNEYVFGNELMTTDLESDGNIFSWISVGIIERTFNGIEQWYHVNRTFIQSEASQYQFAKNFGCEFLEKSCYEFIKITEMRDPNKIIAPFCSKTQKNLCFGPPGSPSKLYPFSPERDCFYGSTSLFNSNFGNFDKQLIADNGAMPTVGFSSNNVQRRFCPIVRPTTIVPPTFQLGLCPN